MELVQRTVVTFALLTFGLLVFPNHCDAAVQCYECEEWAQEGLASQREGNKYKNCISGGRPELVDDVDPNLPVETYCRDVLEACRRQEIYSENGKLLGVQKGCFRLNYGERINTCLKQKLEYKPHCYRFSGHGFQIELVECIPQEGKSSDAGVNSDEWLMKGPSTEGPAKTRQHGFNPDWQYDLCLCNTDYCNEKSEIGEWDDGGADTSAGISFKRIMTTGGTGLMIIFPAIFAAIQ